MKLLPSFTGQPERNRIYHTDALTLLSAMNDESVDLIVTSPPYDDLRDYNGYTFDYKPIGREAYRVLKEGGVMVWVVADQVKNGSETLNSMRQALYFKDECGFNAHDTMIYYRDPVHTDPVRYSQAFEYMFILTKGMPIKRNMMRVPCKKSGFSKTGITKRNSDGKLVPANEYSDFVLDTKVMSNVWFLNAGNMKSTKDTFAFDHPAMFPEKLAERHILTWSNEGDLVLDFMCGAGTTCKMAKINKRQYIGCDISLEYVDIARRRVSAYFGMNTKRKREKLPISELPLFEGVI